MFSPSVFAQVNFDYSVEIQNDLRFDVGRLYMAVPDEEDGVGSVITESGDPGFSRNEASVRFKVRVAPVPRIRFVGDVELIWLNMSDRQLSLSQLTQRSAMDPWRLECDAAYVEFRDIVPGLDIRIGRQIVQWGAADMFNPTDNINSDDLEDRVLFGENIANEMIRIDYIHIPEREGWLSEVSVSLIWIPVFRPSQLPRSATLPLADANAPIPVLEDDVRDDIEGLRDIVREFIDDPTVNAEVPEFSIENSQMGLRIQARMGETDFALSYYRGFDDIPVMQRADAALSEDGSLVTSEVKLVYPRMHVLGFDINGQLSFLDNLGFWIEGAVVFPEKVGLTFAFADSIITPGGVEFVGTSVDDRPFLKITAGFDYSFNEHVFVNVQFVRGFINEFGATLLNNFLVAGMDLKFWSDRILFRFFGLLQIDKAEEVSANLFPMLRVNPWGSVELDFGAIIPIGPEESYFGQPATGATTAFFRARASF